jgi:hypothetical protein
MLASFTRAPVMAAAWLHKQPWISCRVGYFCGLVAMLGASNYTFAQARWTHGPRWKCCHPQAKDIACIIAAE